LPDEALDDSLAASSDLNHRTESAVGLPDGPIHIPLPERSALGIDLDFRPKTVTHTFLILVSQ
jgi:hypothetical protein